MGFKKGFLWGAATASYQIEGAWNEANHYPLTGIAILCRNKDDNGKQMPPQEMQFFCDENFERCQGWTTEQIEFLRYTINNQKTLHHSYGFTEEYLLTATDYREVAKKFCDGYERPAENSTRRENNAEKAWKYFVLGEEV
jgi:hypothetical protein